MKNKIAAFVGHSFSKEDEIVVRKFLDFFDTIKKSNADFNWDHAKDAEPKDLFLKVLEKMKDKNLFIGICTEKELVINRESLAKTFFQKDYQKGRRENFKAKTSDWLLQEIGYALGKEMRIMLLVEQGIRNPGELQGNLENIYFSRENPDNSFEKILQMINNLSPREEAETPEQTQSDIASEEKPVLEALDEKYENPNTDWTESDYEKALRHFILMGNKDKEESINKSFLSKYQNGDIRIKWEALKLYSKGVFNNENNLAKIKSIEESHPEIPEIKIYLARIYNKYEDLPKAAEYFEKASDLMEDEFDRLINYCESAKLNATNGKKAKSILLFEKAKSLVKGIEDREIWFLKELQNLAKTTKQFTEYLAFGERILSIKPEDHMTRFHLAYRYSDLEQYDMALFHYKILTRNYPNDATWNNLGVAQSGLGLKGKAVDSFIISQKNDGTLAMNNIARSYMGEGFYDDAKDICKKATEIEGYDKKIGETDSEIDKKIQEENKREEEIIEKTNANRNFGVKFGLACAGNTPSQLSGTWSGGPCPLKITIENNSIVAEGEYEKEISSSLADSLGLGLALTGKKTTTKIEIKYYGEILGRGIRFNKSVSGERPSILAGSSDNGGLMVISEGLNEIQVYEKNKADSENFYFLRKSEATDASEVRELKAKN